MKRLVLLGLLTLGGCAKTGRAWVMDNSPFWDMLYEGALLHLTGLIIAGAIWWWLRNDWRFEGTWKPLLIAAAIVGLFSGIGLYRGNVYIHTPCSWSQERRNDCPAYKNKLWRINDRWDAN